MPKPTRKMVHLPIYPKDIEILNRVEALMRRDPAVARFAVAKASGRIRRTNILRWSLERVLELEEPRG